MSKSEYTSAWRKGVRVAMERAAWWFTPSVVLFATAALIGEGRYCGVVMVLAFAALAKCLGWCGCALYATTVIADAELYPTLAGNRDKRPFWTEDEL